MCRALLIAIVSCFVILGCVQKSQPQNVAQAANTASSNASELDTSSPMESQNASHVAVDDADVSKAPIQETEEIKDSSEMSQTPEAQSFDTIPENMFVCQVDIEVHANRYSAQSLGPTLEEAIDNSVDEACAIDCAPHVQDDSLSEEDSEAAIEDCVATCVDQVQVLAQTCWQAGEIVYSQDSDSMTDDPSEVL